MEHGKKLSITYRNIYHTWFACFMMLLKKIRIRCSGKLINFWFLHLKKTTHLAIQTFFGSVVLSSSYSHFSLIHVNLLPKGWGSFEMLDSFEWAVGRVEGSRCPGTPNRRGSKQHSLKEKSINRGWMTVCFCMPWAILHSSHTVTKALVATHQHSGATFLIISNAKTDHCSWVEIHCKSHCLALPNLPHLQLGV